jgi:hypothetical protein
MTDHGSEKYKYATFKAAEYNKRNHTTVTNQNFTNTHVNAKEQRQ